MLTLSASYRKEYYSDQYELIEQREAEYRARTISLLRSQLDHGSGTPVSCFIILLLIHHCMVNEDGDHCWSVHSKAANELRSLGPCSPSVFTAFQVVLARTACPLKDSRVPLSHEYDWLGSGTENELRQIDGIIGVSRAVLHIINSITALSHSTVG